MGHEIRTDKELIDATKALLDWLDSQGLDFGDAVQVMAGAACSLEGVVRVTNNTPNLILPLFIESYLTWQDHFAKKAK